MVRAQSQYPTQRTRETDGIESLAAKHAEAKCLSFEPTTSASKQALHRMRPRRRMRSIACFGGHLEWSYELETGTSSLAKPLHPSLTGIVFTHPTGTERNCKCAMLAANGGKE